MSILQKHFLSLFYSRSTTLIPASLYCRLSTTTTSPKYQHFPGEDSLTNTLHFSPTQATRTSKHLSHLKPPSNSDAVISFLTSLGLTSSDIDAVAASYPRILCASVDKTLTPKVAVLRDLAWPDSQIVRLLTLAPMSFYSHDLRRQLHFWLPLLGSVDSLLKVMKRNNSLLNYDIEKVVKPNLRLLEQCGIDVSQIAKLIIRSRALVTTNPELLKTMVKRAEELGFSRGSKMFQYALMITLSLSPETVEAKMEFLKTELGWSDSEVHASISRSPLLLTNSSERLKGVWEFLINEVGLERGYVVRTPLLFCFSIERRMVPRHYVMKVLRAKGLLGREYMFCSVLVYSDKKFLEKFIHPYREVIPGLPDYYAAACGGKAPIEVEL